VEEKIIMKKSFKYLLMAGVLMIASLAVSGCTEFYVPAALAASFMSQ
jgi:hypothetical protein